jgi:hypothetical protein
MIFSRLVGMVNCRHEETLQNMGWRITKAFLFGCCVTGLGLALFIFLIVVGDDGGANERRLPFIDAPLICISYGILWPVTLGANLSKNDPGVVVLLLFLATIAFWAGIYDLIGVLKRKHAHPKS